MLSFDFNLVVDSGLDFVVSTILGVSTEMEVGLVAVWSSDVVDAFCVVDVAEGTADEGVVIADVGAGAALDDVVVSSP